MSYTMFFFLYKQLGIYVGQWSKPEFANEQLANMFQLMEGIKTLLSSSLHGFIHKDFHQVVDRMTIIDTFIFLVKTLPRSTSFHSLYTDTYIWRIIYIYIYILIIVFLFLYNIISSYICYIDHVRAHVCRLCTRLINWAYGIGYLCVLGAL